MSDPRAAFPDDARDHGSPTGPARYADDTVRGFAAPPQKTALLVANGLLSNRLLRQARRSGVLERLERSQRTP